jgi:hypothetical protein
MTMTSDVPVFYDCEAFLQGGLPSKSAGPSSILPGRNPIGKPSGHASPTLGCSRYGTRTRRSCTGFLWSSSLRTGVHRSKAQSAGGKETVAHAVKISSGGAPIFLVAEEQTFMFGSG